jgi:hypothetical protein
MVYTASIWLSRIRLAEEIATALLPLNEINATFLTLLSDSVPWCGPNWYATKTHAGGTPAKVVSAVVDSEKHLMQALGVSAGELVIYICSAAVGNMTVPVQTTDAVTSETCVMLAYSYCPLSSFALKPFTDLLPPTINYRTGLSKWNNPCLLRNHLSATRFERPESRAEFYNRNLVQMVRTRIAAYEQAIASAESDDETERLTSILNTALAQFGEMQCSAHLPVVYPEEIFEAVGVAVSQDDLQKMFLDPKAEVNTVYIKLSLSLPAAQSHSHTHTHSSLPPSHTHTPLPEPPSPREICWANWMSSLQSEVSSKASI